MPSIRPLVKPSLVLGFVVTSLLCPATGQTEEGEDLAVGARVRVTAPEVSRDFFGGDSDRRLVGQVLSLDDEMLTVKIKRHEEPAVVPLSSMQRLEIRTRPSRKGRGALIGFLVGTGIGILGSAVDKGSSACDSTSLSGCDVILSTVALGLPGALLGALTAPGEEWKDLPLATTEARTSSSNGGLDIRVVPMVGRRTGLTLVGSF